MCVVGCVRVFTGGFGGVWRLLGWVVWICNCGCVSRVACQEDIQICVCKAFVCGGVI